MSRGYIRRNFFIPNPQLIVGPQLLRYGVRIIPRARTRFFQIKTE
jgi:hypothetical protein